MSIEKQITEILEYVKGIDKRTLKMEKTLISVDERLESLEETVSKLEQWVPIEDTPAKPKRNRLVTG